MQKITLRQLPAANQRGILTIMTLWFLMNAGFFMLIPLLSIHFVDGLGWAAAFIGLVLAVRQFTQQSLTMFGGALSDRFSAKKLIMFGVFIRSISFVIIGYAATEPALLFAAFLAALGGAFFDAPGKAVLAALTPEEMISDVYAQVGILQNSARMLGPLIGTLLIALSFSVVGLAAAGFFMIAFIVAGFGLPDISVSNGKQAASQGLKAAFQDRAFVTYTALLMGFWFMWVQISIALPLKAKYLTDSTNSVGMLLMVNGIIAIALQVPALKLAQRFLLPLPMLILGIVSMAFGLGSVAWVQNMNQLYVCIFFFALGTVLVTPNAQTVAATMANPQARGAYFGLNSLALAIGGGIGQIAGGTMVDLALVWHFPPLPWLVSAFVGTAAAIGLIQFYKHNRLSVTPPALLAPSK